MLLVATVGIFITGPHMVQWMVSPKAIWRLGGGGGVGVWYGYGNQEGSASENFKE